MRRADLRELHNMAKIRNLPSIMSRGILSHRRIEQLGISHESVARAGIQAIRAARRVPGGRPLHEYACIYVNGRNAMLNVVLREVSHTEMMVIGVNTSVLELPGVVVTDKNASATTSYPRFSGAREGIERLERDYVFSESWKHPDDWSEENRHKQAMQAEVLVPDVIPPTFLARIYVSCERSRRAVVALVDDKLPVIVDAHLFFR